MASPIDTVKAQTAVSTGGRLAAVPKALNPFVFWPTWETRYPSRKLTKLVDASIDPRRAGKPVVPRQDPDSQIVFVYLINAQT